MQLKETIKNKFEYIQTLNKNLFIIIFLMNKWSFIQKVEFVYNCLFFFVFSIISCNFVFAASHFKY